MNEEEIKKLLKKIISIDGSGNVVGDKNYVKSIKQTGGDYSILIEGGVTINISIDDLKQIVPPLHRNAKIDHFVNRTEEIDNLIANLQPGLVVSLHGPGGIGKSALVIETLWKMTPEDALPLNFPDGIVFIKFDKKIRLEDVYNEIISAFGEVKESEKIKPLDKVKQVLSNKKALIVLDATESIENLEPLLEIRGNCCILITSRTREHAGARWENITPLEKKYAVSLLKRWSEIEEEEENVLEDICELVGRLPLAIRLIGQYILHQAQYPKDYLDWLQETPLEALGEVERQSQSIIIILEESFSTLKVESKRALALSGLLGNSSFTKNAFTTLLDGDSRKAGRGLGELVKLGFLVKVNDRYDFSHSLLHAFAQSKIYILSPEELDSAIKNLIKHFSTTAIECFRQYSTHSLSKTEYDHQIKLEEPHILVALQVLKDRFEDSDSANYQLLIDFINAVYPFWKDRSDYEKQASWLKEAYFCYAKLDKTLDKASRARRVGRILSWQGKLDEALAWMEHCEKALNGDASKKANVIRARMYVHQASIKYQLGDDTAEQDCMTGIEIVDKNEEAEIYAEGSNIIGAIWLYDNKLSESLKMFEQSLHYWEKEGDKYEITRVKDNISTVRYYLGKFTEMRESDEASLQYWEQFPNRIELAMSLTNRGLVHEVDGEFNQAVELNQRAIELSDKLKVQRTQANVRLNIAGPLISLREFDKAEQYLNEGLEFDKGEYEIDIRRNLAKVELGRKNGEKALELAKFALDMARDGVKDDEVPMDVGAALRTLGKAYHLNGDFEKAQEYMETSYALLQNSEYRYEEYLTAGSLAQLYKEMQNSEKLKETEEQINHLAKNMGLNTPE